MTALEGSSAREDSLNEQLGILRESKAATGQRARGFSAAQRGTHAVDTRQRTCLQEMERNPVIGSY
eukprot:53469-Amphidinium_carterae.3